MKLRGVDYGPISCGSGAMGFFGDGKEYWFHKWLKWFGLVWAGCTFVAKTMTVHKNDGNMTMKADGITPRDLMPDCIWISHWYAIAVNAVGLSNPGSRALLTDGRWQARTEPFMLSFMPIGKDRDERQKETQEFVGVLSRILSFFKTPFALQVNFSCPNTEHAAASLEEHLCLLDVLETLGIPLVVKLAVDYPVQNALTLSEHPAVDALCVSNTVKFGTPNVGIRWSRWFKSAGGSDSPVYKKNSKYGPGGMSGKPLLKLVAKYVAELRDAGVEKPIQAGGGILHPHDVALLANAGADSVFIASVAFLRPWRVRSIIQEAHRVFGMLPDLDHLNSGPKSGPSLAARPESEQ